MLDPVTYFLPSGERCLNPDCEAGRAGTERIYRHGKTRRGVQRFRCLDCGKTFTERKGSAMHMLRSDEQAVMEVAANVIGGRRSIAAASEYFGIPYPTVKRWVAAVKDDPGALHRFTHDFSNVDQGTRALLLLAVELGLTTIEQRQAALVALAGGNYQPTHGILHVLAQAIGGAHAFAQRLGEDADLLERTDAIDFP